MFSVGMLKTSYMGALPVFCNSDVTEDVRDIVHSRIACVVQHVCHWGLQGINFSSIACIAALYWAKRLCLTSHTDW